jgi:hypothetical protein
MNDPYFSNSTRSGTVGGLLTVLLVNISSGDILKTIILTAIGAVISFFISFGLKVLLKKWKR